MRDLSRWCRLLSWSVAGVLFISACTDSVEESDWVGLVWDGGNSALAFAPRSVNATTDRPEVVDGPMTITIDSFLVSPSRLVVAWREELDDTAVCCRSGVVGIEVVTEQGDRLWLFYGHGGTMSSGWFCQGSFA